MDDVLVAIHELLCYIYIQSLLLRLFRTFYMHCFCRKNLCLDTDSSSVQHCAPPETVTILLGCNEQHKNAWVYYIGRSKLCSNTPIIDHTIWYAAYFLNSLGLYIWELIGILISLIATSFIFKYQVSTTPPLLTPPAQLLHLLITLLQRVRASSVAIIKFWFVRQILDELCDRVAWKW
jgi:hypothetical protein